MSQEKLSLNNKIKGAFKSQRLSSVQVGTIATSIHILKETT